MEYIIKYRCWFEPHKKMYKVKEMSFLDDYVHVVLEGGFSPSKNNSTLMQYTGLMDKYNKEIYENDIICYNKPYIVKKQWHGGYLPFNEIFKDAKNESKAYVILGNIFEDSELIGNGKSYRRT